ncbi:hypothetical protein [Methanoculleus sp. UBA291]|uniref:hypothetical protein n=1 Tax=Methanoculleus sp. UBA291 TaxID=1915495 RepID=UPI00316ACE4F
MSVWTLDGRLKLRYTRPQYFPAVATVKQTDLVYRDGAFWLYATVETPDVEPPTPPSISGGEHRHHERRSNLLQRRHREGAAAIRKAPGVPPEDRNQVGQAEIAKDLRQRTPV